MKFVRMIKLKPLIVSLLIPLGLGGAVGMVLALTGQFSDYRELFQPPLSPSPWVFFVAWVILYTLMGISSYLVLTADKPVGARSDALWLYFVQLGVNRQLLVYQQARRAFADSVHSLAAVCRIP